MRRLLRRSGAIALLAGLSACTPDPKRSGGAADSAGATDGATDTAGATDGAADGAADGSAPPTLNGTRPESELPAPDFSATNRDGAARDREDLLGGPTVMWFYPAATTAG